jgi:hypothetical protein
MLDHLGEHAAEAPDLQVRPGRELSSRAHQTPPGAHARELLHQARPVGLLQNVYAGGEAHARVTVRTQCVGTDAYLTDLVEARRELEHEQQ